MIKEAELKCCFRKEILLLSIQNCMSVQVQVLNNQDNRFEC